jgi:peptide/nickel transport system substrate-binding protein
MRPKLAVVLYTLVLVASLVGVCLADGTVVVGLEAEPTSLDAHQTSDYNSGRAAYPLYNTLPQFVAGSTDIEPGLAKSWNVSEDGLVWTFHLREDVVFHDGTPFNAEAVKFNIERQTDPEHPYHDTGVFPYAGFTFGTVESVEVIDEFTVNIMLKYNFSPFIRNLAISSASMVSPAAVKKYGSDISINPVGTGPFRFVEWEPGVRIVIERNPDYWGEPATLDTLIFRPVINPQGRLAALEAGEVDFIVNPPPEDIERLRTNPDLQVVAELGQHTWYLVFNCQTPPFDNKLVRQAIHYAIDKEAIVEEILKNTGLVAKNPLPPNVWSYTEDVRVYDYDPSEARSLLAQAGFPNGLDVEFWVPETGSGMQQPVEMATAIQAYLAQVGINAKIQTWEWGIYLDKVFQEDYTLIAGMHEMSWIMDNGDPDNLLYVLLSSEQWPPNGFNESFYKNVEVDRLLLRARQISDPEEREKLYVQAQQIICEESPWVWIDHAYETFVMRADMEGFVFQPTQGRLRFENVTFSG